MSEGQEKIIEQLPDVWFDWYARLIPGCFGAGLYLYLSSKELPAFSGVNVAVFLLCGYALGHALQPPADVLVQFAEEKLYHNEEKYAKAKRDGVGTSLLNKVSKAHAEAVSMLAFGLLLVLNLVWFWSTLNRKWMFTSLVVYFALAAVERIRARNRKINDLT